MPVIDESSAFRSPDLHDDEDSHGTQDSEDFGTIPADQEILGDMRDDFSERLPDMGDGNIDVGVENLDLIFEETAVDNVPDNNDVDETKIPRGKSIAHHILFHKAVFLSFDIETGGEKCGIIQISCECFQILNGEGERKGTFDEYVNPGPNAVWNEAASSASHKLHRHDPRIVNAKRLPEVWERFSTFIKSNVGRHQKGIMIAWNGESCDMRWIYKVAQAPNTTLSLPDKIQYFLDPFKVISQYRL